jgi:hypothetical protein
MKRVVACVMGTLCLACQTYSAVPFSGLRAGNNVRLTVTNDGSLAVAPQVGRDVQSVEGKVRSVDTTGVTLLIESVNRGTEESERVDTSTVRLRPGGVSAAELRSVDKPKSFLVTALIVAGALAVAQGVGNGGFFGFGHGGSGNTR